MIVGFLLVDSGIRGNGLATIKQLESDITGFLAFAAAILILGGVGMFNSARPVAKAMLFLVFIVFFLKNGVAISQNLKAGINSPVTPQGSLPGSDYNPTTGNTSLSNAPTLGVLPSDRNSDSIINHGIDLDPVQSYLITQSIM